MLYFRFFYRESGLEKQETKKSTTGDKIGEKSKVPKKDEKTLAKNNFLWYNKYINKKEEL